jgi:hypothetical protein
MEKNIKKDKHFTCSNCKRMSRVRFKTNFICVGLIKKPKIPHDIYRLYISGTQLKFDLMLEEVIIIFNLLSDLLLAQLVIKKNKNG